MQRLPLGHCAPNPSLSAWILAFTVLSFAVQVSATGLIAWRILATFNWRQRCSWTREWHALRIVVESGLVYSMLTVLSLAFYLAKTKFGSINVGILTQASVSMQLASCQRESQLLPDDIRLRARF